MSTVKIKTEPPTETTAVAVDVQVKLEPSFSTGDIKLEQHTSDIDTKLEPDTEADSVEDEDECIKSESVDDTDQETVTSNKQRQFICKHPECDRSFKNSSNLSIHQHEHKLQTKLYIHGKTYNLTRQSLNDRWSCPIPDCTSTLKTVDSVCGHIRSHMKTIGQQQQLSLTQTTQRNLYFLDVDDFYMNGVRCGYYNTIGVFICHECRLVPECLLIHLQQKHGYDEKSIDNSDLPESAVTASADPNINQHTSNSHLASAISKPHWRQQHQGILQGWLCVTSDCGYCGPAGDNKFNHRARFHQDEQITTVPALVLRLGYSKSNSCYFLITRIDQASGAVATSNSKVNQHKLDYNHNGLNTEGEAVDDSDQNETTEGFNQRRSWKCEYPNCGRLFSSSDLLSGHRREHKLEVVINVQGTTFTLSRQSLDDKWVCAIPDCEATYKSVSGHRLHILSAHGALLKQKRANSEDDDNNQQQHKQIAKKRQPNFQYLQVDGFYVSGTRYGYHTATGVFVCYKCRLVPECLLTHMQQKHEFNEKSIDNSALPKSAADASADPNIDQHTNNPHLASAISQSGQLYYPDIVKGWLCIKSDCGYCQFTRKSKNRHQCEVHKGEQPLTVPALVLRLLYSKAQTSSFLITRLDTVITSSVKPTNSTNQINSENDDDDGDELVLSDYSDEDDIN